MAVKRRIIDMESLIPKRKTKKRESKNKGKIITRATGVQKLRAIQKLENRKETVRKFSKNFGHSFQKLYRWRKQAPKLKELPLDAENS